MKILLYFFVTTLLVGCSVQSAKNAERKESNKPEQIVSKHFIPEVPDMIFFCDDTISIDDFDIKERLDNELVVNTYYHSSTILAMKRTTRYFPLIEKILREEGLPDDLKYLSLIESNLIPTITSPTGARGLWQFMPHTGKEYGLRIDEYVDERLDVEKSTRAACQYLRKAYNEFHDWSLACASYNRGVGGMRSDVQTQYGDNYYDLHLNAETGRYIFRLLAMKLIIENPTQYGFDLSEQDKYYPVKIKTVVQTEDIKDLAAWSKNNGTTYRKVRVLNPWILSNKLIVRKDTFNIALPN